MENKLKEQMDILQRIPYKTVDILEDGKIKNKTVVYYEEILKEIGSIRRQLEEEGFMYLNGKLKKI